MAQLMRFGRRVPLPSTVQIVHDLLVAQRDENAQRAKEAKDGPKDGPSQGDPESAPTPAGIRVLPQG